MASAWFERVSDIIPKVLAIFFLETTKDLAVFEENLEHKLENTIPWSLWLYCYKTHGDISLSGTSKGNKVQASSLQSLPFWFLLMSSLK